VLCVRVRAAASGFLHSPRLLLKHEEGPATADYRLRFERTARDLTLYLNLERFDQSSYYLATLWKRLPAMVDILFHTPPVAMAGNVNISDGIDATAGELAFCSNHPDSILVPDRMFLAERCYRPFRKAALRQGAWSERTPTVLWRGGTNGMGEIANSTMSPADPDLMQRIRICLALRESPGCDVKLSGIGRNQGTEENRQRIASLGLIGNKIPPLHWSRVKYALDIDGVTNAWSNLYTRLLMGCCVLKVASPLGYKQWYYDELRPWEHFVPVAADLSDLHERLAWCREHDDEARRIAVAGQLFALRRTRQTELLAVTQRMNERLKQPAANADFSTQRAA
jgi:hypothetical protein